MPTYSRYSGTHISFEGAPRFGKDESQEIASLKSDSGEKLSLKNWVVTGSTSLFANGVASIVYFLTF